MSGERIEGAALETRGKLVSVVCLSILVALAYSESMDNGFTFDDRAIILQNPLVGEQRWQEIFSSAYWQGVTGVAEGLYRPITVATYALNHAFSGANPALYHFVNLIIHLVVAGTLFALSRSHLSMPASFVAGILFALHPALSEAVNSVVGRAELLAAGFALSAVWTWKGISPGNRLGVGLGVGTFFLLLAAQLAKESGLVVACGLGLCALITRRTLACWLPPIAAAIAGPMLKWGATGRLLPTGIGFLDNPLAYAEPAVRVLNGFDVIVRYAKLLIFPWPLTADYSYNQIPTITDLASPAIWLPTLLIASLAVPFWRTRFWQRSAFLWVVISGGGLLAFSNVVLVSGTIFAERLLYLPAAGFCLLVAWSLSTLSSAPRVIVAAAWIVVALALTNAQTARWRDDQSLFAHAARVSTNSARSHFGYGLALHEGGDPGGAVVAYDKALRIYPPYAEAHYNRGAALLALDRRAEALEAYGMAAAARPGYAAAVYAAAVLSANLGRAEEARKWVRRYSQIAPGPTIDGKQWPGLEPPAHASP